MSTFVLKIQCYLPPKYFLVTLKFFTVVLTNMYEENAARILSGTNETTNIK